MLIATLLLLLAMGYLMVEDNNFAIATLQPSDGYNINGHVTFQQMDGYVLITVNVRGLSDGEHGFHIHTTGDINHDCAAAGGHYNPTDADHGGLTGGHAGDLGNITSINGKCIEEIKTNKFRLADVINRTIVIHAEKDDLGLGGDAESLKTGNSGARVACGIINKT